MQQTNVTRRRILRSSAVAGGIFLAGCSSDSNGQNENTGGGNGGDGTGSDGGDGPCSGIATAMDDTERWNGEGAESLVTFAYPSGWEPTNSDDFSEEHAQMNVGNRFGEDGPSLDIQIRTYYAPAEEGHVESELENPNKSAVEYDYAGQTRTAAVTEVIDESLGPGAELTVPNPETGENHRVAIIPTLNGGPCAEEVRQLVVSMVKSLEPNDGTTFEAD